MEYHYRQVRCPYCGKAAPITKTINEQELKGSPVRQCLSCGQKYIDREYKEPAIIYYNSQFKQPDPVGHIIKGAIFGGITVFAFFMAADGGYVVFKIFLIIIFGLLALLNIDKLVAEIIHAFNKEKHKEAVQKKVISYLEGNNQSPEIKESLERLGNAEYINLLRKSGISVPTYFIERATKQ